MDLLVITFMYNALILHIFDYYNIIVDKGNTNILS